MRSSTSCGVPAAPPARSCSTGWPITAARRSTSASSAPQHTVRAADSVRVAGSRPIASPALATRAQAALKSSIRANGVLNSAAYVAARRGVRFAPKPPMTIGGAGALHRLGQSGRVLDLVVRAGERERLALGHAPEAGDDGELLFEHVEAVLRRG